MRLRTQIAGKYKTKEVFLNGEPLLPDKSLKFRDHSPDGFDWGYCGNGASQLALAICLEILPAEEALKVYQNFKWKYIASLPELDFSLYIDTAVLLAEITEQIAIEFAKWLHSEECKDLVHGYKIVGEDYSIERMYKEFLKKTEL